MVTRLALIVVTIAFVAVGAAAEPQATGISVSGTAIVKGKPDVAIVTLGVTTEDKDAAKAAQTNARTATAVVEAIVDFGIPKSDIETVQFSVSPVMDYRQSPATTVGYRVSNVVRVKVRDLPKIGGLIDKAVGAGSNGVQGVRFDIEDPTKLRHEALSLAVKKAEADARLMADMLGAKLGKVTYASETGPITTTPLDMGVMRAESASSPIIPGEIEVSAGVTVVYAIL